MNWEALGAIGEIVGAVAVVVTLGFLSWQLRQNTRAMRSATWQAIQEAEHQFDKLIGQDRETAAIVLRGMAEGKAAFDDDEVTALQWWSIGKQLLELFQTHHYQYELGLIDEDWWQTWVSQYELSMMYPGFRELVQDRYPHLRAAFKVFIDAHPHRRDIESAQQASMVTGGSVTGG